MTSFATRLVHENMKPAAEEEKKRAESGEPDPMEALSATADEVAKAMTGVCERANRLKTRLAKECA